MALLFVLNLNNSRVVVIADARRQHRSCGHPPLVGRYRSNAEYFDSIVIIMTIDIPCELFRIFNYHIMTADARENTSKSNTSPKP